MDVIRRWALLVAAIVHIGMMMVSFVFNAPVNAAVDAWMPASLSTDWPSYRLRWEMGHALAALFPLSAIRATHNVLAHRRMRANELDLSAEGIMASVHVTRINRPNAWPQPTSGTEKRAPANRGSHSHMALRRLRAVSTIGLLSAEQRNLMASRRANKAIGPAGTDRRLVPLIE
jgi:hypothetical protein